jgi:hypothetical protein
MGSGSNTIGSLKAIYVLNELLRTLCGSLTAYLADARPWTQSDDRQLRAALDHLVADQQRYARRVSEAITAQGGRPEPGRFPMNFTAKHDLSLEYLLSEVIEGQKRDVSAIEHCAAQLEDIALLHSLAEEILGNARGHLEVLQETRNEQR